VTATATPRVCGGGFTFQTFACSQMAGGSDAGTCARGFGILPAQVFFQPYRPGTVYTATGRGCASAGNPPQTSCQQSGPLTATLGTPTTKYSVTNNACVNVTLTAGQSCTVEFAFTPTASGSVPVSVDPPVGGLPPPDPRSRPAAQPHLPGSVSVVRRGTPAHEAGLNVDDEILAIDDLRVRADGLVARMDQYKVGDRIRLLVARRDRLVTLDVTLAAEPGRPWRLQPAPDQTAEQKARLEAWLGR